MRNNLRVSLVAAVSLGLLSPLLTPGTASAQTLTVSFETTPVGASVYAPTNVVAVWIEDSGGNFVKTIGRYSLVRTVHLVAWNAASGGDEDAVSGATRLDHNTALSFDWKLRANGELVPEGTYTVRVEVADDNSTTADQNHQGSFTFEHNGEASNQDLTVEGFNNVDVNYDPTPDGGGGDGSGDGTGDGSGGEAANSGVAIGACSATSGSGGSLALLLCLALLAAGRRRRKHSR
jgi:MYXO-CTERM domain-containing protein